MEGSKGGGVVGVPDGSNANALLHGGHHLGGVAAVDPRIGSDYVSISPYSHHPINKITQ